MITIDALAPSTDGGCPLADLAEPGLRVDVGLYVANACAAQSTASTRDTLYGGEEGRKCSSTKLDELHEEFDAYLIVTIVDKGIGFWWICGVNSEEPNQKVNLAIAGFSKKIGLAWTS